MAPPGKKVLINKTPQHGNIEWYIGMSPLHYRCYRIYVPETRGKRTAKTVECFPHNGAIPAFSSADTATDAARFLADALANPALATPFARFGSQTMDVIRKLAEIFAASSTVTPTSTTPQICTHVTTPLPRLQGNANPHTLSKVPPEVRPHVPPQSPPAPPTTMQPSRINLHHRYPLRSCTWANHMVEAVGEDIFAFQVDLDPATEKNRGTHISYAAPIKEPGLQNYPTTLSDYRKV